MSDICKKCGGHLVPKGFIYKSDKTPRYHRMKCKECKSLDYQPCDDRENMAWDKVESLYKEGVLRVWHEGKAWSVK